MDTLEQMMGGNPGAFFERQQQWNSEQQRRQADLASVMQQTSQREQLLPLDIKQRQVNIDADAARLPGIQADSSIRSRQNKKEDLLFDDEMKAHIGKLKAEEAKRYGEQLKGAADAYAQAGAYLRSAGLKDKPSAIAAAKQILGPYWREELGNFEINNSGLPGAAGETGNYGDVFGGILNNLGSQMGEANAKYRQQLELLDIKNQFALKKQQEEFAAKDKLAQYQAGVRTALAKITANKDPKTYEQAVIQLRQAQMEAMSSGDTEKFNFLQTEIDKMIALQHGMATAAAGARKEGTIDPAAVSGLPKVPAQPVPRLPAPEPPKAPAPAASSPPIQNNPKAAPSSGSPAQAPKLVKMLSPGGEEWEVPFEKQKEAEAKGWKVK